MKDNINYFNCMKRKCEQCKNYINCFKYKKEKKQKGEKKKNDRNTDISMDIKFI